MSQIAGHLHGQGVVAVPGLLAHEKTILANIVTCIVERSDPIRVILFGSRARGQARPNSDADLLVVVPHSEHLREEWASLLDAVASFPIEADLVLTSPEEFAWRSLVPGFVQYDAMRDGLVLYERR